MEVLTGTASDVAGQSDTGMAVAAAGGANDARHGPVCLGYDSSSRPPSITLIGQYHPEVGKTILNGLSPSWPLNAHCLTAAQVNVFRSLL